MNNQPYQQCAVSHCDLEANSRKPGALCNPHYQKKYRGVDPETYVIPADHPARTAPICREPECERKAQTKGYCPYHRLRAQMGKTQTAGHINIRPACGFDTCELPIESGGYCKGHREQLRRGEPIRELRDYGVYTKGLKCPVPSCKKAQETRGMCASHATLQAKYGLTPEEFYAVWENPVCSNPGCGQTTRLHMDHDHSTGKFRALLCNGCNTSLGFLKESPERIRGLAAYIERFQV